MSMMPFPPDEKKLKQAKALLDAKRYDEAREVLELIDHHPKARLWLAKLAEMEFTGARKVKAQNRSIHHTLRLFWGFLILLSCGWMSYGVMGTGVFVDRVMSATPERLSIMPTLQGSDPATRATIQAFSDNAQLATRGIGALLGAQLGLGFFLCTGMPLFWIFVLFYWRNGVAIRQERHHAEMVNATRRL